MIVGSAAHRAKHLMEEKPEERDDELDAGVPQERRVDPRGPPAGERGAHRHPAKKDSEDKHLGVGTVAQEEPEVAAPEGLIHQRGPAREGEGRVQCTAQRARGHLGLCAAWLSRVPSRPALSPAPPARSRAWRARYRTANTARPRCRRNRW